MARRTLRKPRRRTFGMRLRMGNVIVGEILIMVCVALMLRFAVALWAVLLSVFGIVVLLTITYRSYLLNQWVQVWWRNRRNNRSSELRQERVSMPAPFDVRLDDEHTVAVRWDGDTLVSVVAIYPRLDVPTVLVTNTMFTADVVPLGALGSMLDQADIHLSSIDVVSAGQRVAGDVAFSVLYDEIISGRPAVGVRSTYVVLRLEPAQNGQAIHRRGADVKGTVRTMASAALRTQDMLRGLGHPAKALDASGFADAETVLCQKVDLLAATESWNELISDRLRVTTYFAKAQQIDAQSIASWWSHRAYSTVVGLRLVRPDRHGEFPQVSALVRYSQLGSSDSDPGGGLTQSTGAQFDSFLAMLPGGDRSTRFTNFSAPIDTADLDDFRVPVGPSGQILGTTASGDVLALPLVDRRPDSPPRRIFLAAGDRFTKQLVLRAVATGASVEVLTDQPALWHEFAQLIGAPHRMWLAPDTSSVRPADIRLCEGCFVAFEGPAVTTISRRDAGHAIDPDADIVIAQSSTDSRQFRLQTSLHNTTLAVIDSHTEERFLGVPRTTPSTHGRTPHTLSSPARPSTTGRAARPARPPLPPGHATGALSTAAAGPVSPMPFNGTPQQRPQLLLPPKHGPRELAPSSGNGHEPMTRRSNSDG